MYIAVIAPTVLEAYETYTKLRPDISIYIGQLEPPKPIVVYKQRNEIIHLITDSEFKSPTRGEARGVLYDHIICVSDNVSAYSIEGRMKKPYNEMEITTYTSQSV